MIHAPRIAIVGSINLDIVASATRLPSPGETVSGTAIARHPGGKGANQALAAQRLGAQASLIGRVGADATAGEALALLRSGGVDLSRVLAIDGLDTGVALIVVSAAGENQIVVASGANSALTAGDVANIEAETLLCQLEVPVDAVLAATTGFKGRVIVNLAPAKPVPEALLRRADVLVVNETEADFYGEALQETGALIATTLGARGARLSRGRALLAQAPAPEVEVVDTTGAGATFCAALGIALAEAMTPVAALEFACAAAALACTRAGAQPSLPFREETLALLGR